MTKETYFQSREELKSQLPKIKFGDKPTEVQKEKITEVNKKIKELVLEYIDKNKPCNKGDNVQIVTRGGRKVTGVVMDFGILHDGNVHPITYKSGSKTLYISQPTLKVTVL